MTWTTHYRQAIPEDERRRFSPAWLLLTGDFRLWWEVVRNGRKHDEFCSFAGPDAPCSCGYYEQ